MLIGVVRESAPGETRVAATPTTVGQLIALGYDVVIEGARYFDGTGGPSSIRHLGIVDGRVTRVSADPITEAAERRIDARGRWVMPGMIDSHARGICTP